MKLKDITHGDMKYNSKSSRFVIFDKDGDRIRTKKDILAFKQIIPKTIEDISWYLDIRVLEVKKSKYIDGYIPSIRFDTTHIKLNIRNKELKLKRSKLKFGEVEEDYELYKN